MLQEWDEEFGSNALCGTRSGSNTLLNSDVPSPSLSGNTDLSCPQCHGPLADVRMVDFANTYFGLDAEEVDQGYIKGVKSTIAVLEDIISGRHRGSYENL
jgi:hypothetical protein